MAANNHVQFTTNNDRREVTTDVGSITTASERFELSWSLNKTEIDWEYAGSYVYVMERQQQ